MKDENLGVAPEITGRRKMLQQMNVFNCDTKTTVYNSRKHIFF
jgi:hypothetical protein